MAARLPGYELVDLFGGLDALKDKVLRTRDGPESSAMIRCGSCARPGSPPSGIRRRRRRARGHDRTGSQAGDRLRDASPAS